MQEKTVTVGSIPTRVRMGGTGRPLLYLHGVAPAGSWMAAHESLARSFTVYAPDHPGFGDTPRPDGFGEMSDFVFHYDELIRRLGLDRPLLVGFSLGGWIAAELAVTYPDRFGALVLVNAAGLHVEGALIPDLAALGGEALARTVFYNLSIAQTYFGAAEDDESRIRRYRAMTTLALVGWNPWFDPKLQQRLSRIQFPTLALWGDHDRLIAPVYGEVYAKSIPGARLELIPECGHMAPVEKPEAMAAAITLWVSRVPSG